MTRRTQTCFRSLCAAGAIVSLLSCQGARVAEKNRQQGNAQTANVKTADANDPLSIHMRAIVVDMHADTVQRMIDEGADINQQLPDGHFDAVRARAGGLDAQFFSIWVEPEYFCGGGQGGIDRADRQSAVVRALA